ncbi:argininosuccinate synthase [bacterium]|nr:argininosuccinate synthase [bacterium]MBU1615200.1 argininosuccinate synthase [bacterium]
MKEIKKIVLAYSGGLDTSVMIKWLRDNYKAEVIAMAADVGQEEELTGLREKALSSGASKFYLEDLKEEFVTSYIFPALAAGAIYEGKYLLGTALARPLIAKRLVEIARIEKAEAIAHGATGKGNDQVRFELTVKALAPDLKIIAPWREWELKSREDEIKYARKHKIDISVTKDKPYSMDRNLWHLSYEGGILEDPANAPDEEMFLLTTSPEKAPDKPTEVEINFKEGIPCEVDGERLSPVELVRKLNKIAGANGIGRVDLVENRLVGMKSRGVYETPAGTLLYLAHRELEHLCLDRETLHYKELISHKYAELIYYGQWFLPLREAFDAFVKVTQERVTGKVKIKLYKGNATIISRQSPYSLYQEDLATFEEDEIYNQKDAEGFINLFGLPLKVLAQSKYSS